MPWGRAPDRRQPAREPRQTPAGDARRHPGNRHRGGIRTGSDPVVTRSAAPPGPRGALDRPHGSVGRGRSRPRARLSTARRLSGLPMSGPSALRSGSDRPPPRSAAAHVADRPARGQPAIASSPARAGRRRDPRHPTRPPPAQFPRPLRRRGPMAAHTIDGFRILGSGFWIGFWNWKNWAGGLPGQRARPGGSGQGDGSPPSRGQAEWGSTTGTSGRVALTSGTTLTAAAS